MVRSRLTWQLIGSVHLLMVCCIVCGVIYTRNVKNDKEREGGRSDASSELFRNV